MAPHCLVASWPVSACLSAVGAFWSRWAILGEMAIPRDRRRDRSLPNHDGGHRAPRRPRSAGPLRTAAQPETEAMLPFLRLLHDGEAEVQRDWHRPEHRHLDPLAA